MFLVTWVEELRSWSFVKCSDAKTAIEVVERETRRGSSNIEIWQAQKVEFEVSVKLV